MTKKKNEDMYNKLRELIGYPPTFGTPSSFVIEALFKGWTVTFGKHSVRGHSQFYQRFSGWIRAKKEGYEVKVNVCQQEPSTVFVTKGKKKYMELGLSEFRIDDLHVGQFGPTYAGQHLPKTSASIPNNQQRGMVAAIATTAERCQSVKRATLKPKKRQKTTIRKFPTETLPTIEKKVCP